MEIGNKPIKYFNNNDIEKCIMIYNDFELIEEKTIELCWYKFNKKLFNKIYYKRRKNNYIISKTIFSIK